MLSVGWSWFSYLSEFGFRGRGVHVPVVPVSPSGGRWVVVVVLVWWLVVWSLFVAGSQPGSGTKKFFGEKLKARVELRVE